MVARGIAEQVVERRRGIVCGRSVVADHPLVLAQFVARRQFQPRTNSPARREPGAGLVACTLQGAELPLRGTRGRAGHQSDSMDRLA